MTDHKDKSKNGSKATQFKKGQSGNKGGRPRKKPVLKQAGNPLLKLSNTTYQGYKNGEPRDLSAKELLQTQIYNQAMKGRIKAIRSVLGWIRKRRESEEAAQPKRSTSCLNVSMETLPTKNANEALRTLDIIRAQEAEDDQVQCDPEFFMQAWAVAAALQRSRAKTLMSDEDLNWALAYTWDKELVKLPRSYKNGR